MSATPEVTISYCLGGLPKTPPAYIFTFTAPAEQLLTLSAQAARILLAINALGGSKVANLSSLAEAALIILKEKTPKTNPINFFSLFD
jgi:hypothetical protein